MSEGKDEDWSSRNRSHFFLLSIFILRRLQSCLDHPHPWCVFLLQQVHHLDIFRTLINQLFAIQVDTTINCHNRIAIPTSYWVPIAQNSVSHSLIFSLWVSFGVKCVSYPIHNIPLDLFLDKFYQFESFDWGIETVHIKSIRSYYW